VVVSVVALVVVVVVVVVRGKMGAFWGVLIRERAIFSQEIKMKDLPTKIEFMAKDSGRMSPF
jgi:hypothetical protein